MSGGISPVAFAEERGVSVEKKTHANDALHFIQHKYGPMVVDHGVWLRFELQNLLFGDCVSVRIV